METWAPDASTERMRRIVRLAAILNLAYFGIEFAVAVAIGSVSLFADSIDFLEDASVNFLILLALNWTARNRARMGMVLAGILLVPGVATLWAAWRKFTVRIAVPATLTRNRIEENSNSMAASVSHTAGGANGWLPCSLPDI